MEEYLSEYENYLKRENLSANTLENYKRDVKLFMEYITSKDFDLLKTYGEERYGYFYLENYHAVYSLEGGINTNICMDSLFMRISS